MLYCALRQVGVTVEVHAAASTAAVAAATLTAAAACSSRIVMSKMVERLAPSWPKRVVGCTMSTWSATSSGTLYDSVRSFLPLLPSSYSYQANSASSRASAVATSVEITMNSLLRTGGAMPCAASQVVTVSTVCVLGVT